jgi:hypothetical protein
MISEFELVFGPRKQYRMTLDVNFLCDLQQATFITPGSRESLRFVRGVLQLGRYPITDKDGRRVERVVKRGEPTLVRWMA